MTARRTLVAVAGLVLILAEQASLQEKPAGGKSGAAAAKETKKEKKDLPLEADRTIAFTTDEGSWISLDVAPDGKQIVFELLGDLYTLPIGGGDAKRITDGMAFDSSAALLAGRIEDRLPLRSQRRREHLDRERRRHRSEGRSPRARRRRYWSPEWTPDGKYIVVSRSGRAAAGARACGCTTSTAAAASS